MAPPIKVEYAKSARSRCTLKACNLFIEKGELRIGTGSMMPGADELSYKWRHLCCFSKIQIKNMQASVDNIEGFEDMEDAHQAVIHKMLKGALVGDNSVRGQLISSVVAAAAEAGPAKGAAKAKKKPGVGALLMGNSNEDLTQTQTLTQGGGGAAKPLKREPTAKKRARAEVTTLDGRLVDTGVESDATDDYEVVLTDQKAPCPYGATCYMKNPAHFRSYSHPGDVATKLEGDRVEPSVVKRIIYERVRIAGPLAGESAAPPAAARAAAPAPVQQPKPAASGGRQPCPYGAMCLMTASPAHLQQYSHGEESAAAVSSAPPQAAAQPKPTSAAAGGRQPCPYGPMCLMMASPAHLQQFSHDDQTATAPPAAAAPKLTPTPSPSPAQAQAMFGAYSLEKTACPYGAACVLSTPAHRLQYSHGEVDAAPRAPAAVVAKKVPLVAPSATSPFHPTAAAAAVSMTPPRHVTPSVSCFGTPEATTAAPFFGAAAATAPAAGGRPECPYLPMCLRSDAKHLAEYAH